MAITVAQTPTPAILAATTSIPLAFVGNVTAGNLVLAFAKGTNIVGVTDNSGDGVPWTQIVPTFGGSSDKGVWAKIAGATGPMTVTATCGTSNTMRLAIREYAGAAVAVDQLPITFVGSVAAATASVGPTAALAAGDLVVCGIVNADTTTVTAGAAAPNADLVQVNGATGLIALEDSLAWPGGAATGTFTFGVNSFGDLFIVGLTPAVAKTSNRVLARRRH